MYAIRYYSHDTVKDLLDSFKVRCSRFSAILAEFNQGGGDIRSTCDHTIYYIDDSLTVSESILSFNVDPFFIYDWMQLFNQTVV